MDCHWQHSPPSASPRSADGAGHSRDRCRVRSPASLPAAAISPDRCMRQTAAIEEPRPPLHESDGTVAEKLRGEHDSDGDEEKAASTAELEAADLDVGGERRAREALEEPLHGDAHGRAASHAPDARSRPSRTPYGHPRGGRCRRRRRANSGARTRLAELITPATIDPAGILVPARSMSRVVWRVAVATGEIHRNSSSQAPRHRVASTSAQVADRVRVGE